MPWESFSSLSAHYLCVLRCRVFRFTLTVLPKLLASVPVTVLALTQVNLTTHKSRGEKKKRKDNAE